MAVTSHEQFLKIEAEKEEADCSHAAYKISMNQIQQVRNWK